MLSNFAILGLPVARALVLLVVLLVVLAFEIAMFISMIRNKRLSQNEKALWIVGALLIHPFVAIAYYFVEYKKAE